MQVEYSPASNGDPTRRDATITWDLPADDGNSPIVAYQLAFAHGGNVQFFLTTAAESGVVDLATPPTEVKYPYSLYNTSGSTQISGANRIYTIPAGTDAFNSRTFTFQNIPVGYEVFFRVRAISGVRNSIELDGLETIGANGAFVTHDAFTEYLTIRTSGRGAWGLVPGHLVPIDPDVYESVDDVKTLEELLEAGVNGGLLPVGVWPLDESEENYDLLADKGIPEVQPYMLAS